MQRLQAVPVDDGVIVGDAAPLVPAGEYVGQFTHSETAVLFKTKRFPGAPKLFLHFRLVEIGPHNGTVLYRPYNVAALIGTPGRGGRFRASRRSDLVHELAIVYGRAFRPDRINLQPLSRVLVRLLVRVVERDREQREIPEPLRYSVIQRLIGLEAGTP